MDNRSALQAKANDYEFISYIFFLISNAAVQDFAIANDALFDNENEQQTFTFFPEIRTKYRNLTESNLRQKVVTNRCDFVRFSFLTLLRWLVYGPAILIFKAH